jgi:hypothetical protein
MNYWTSSTFGRTPWTGDKPAATPISPQDSTIQKYEKYILPLSGIRTHDLGIEVAKTTPWTARTLLYI